MHAPPAHGALVLHVLLAHSFVAGHMNLVVAVLVLSETMLRFSDYVLAHCTPLYGHICALVVLHRRRLAHVAGAVAVEEFLARPAQTDVAFVAVKGGNRVILVEDSTFYAGKI